jgi:hypothetical protein
MAPPSLARDAGNLELTVFQPPPCCMQVGLSSYGLSTVRTKAQSTVQQASKKYGWLLRMHLPTLITRLTLPEATIEGA